MLFRKASVAFLIKCFMDNVNEKLGVGLLYNASLPEYLEHNIEKVDYIEIIPDMFWSDEGRNAHPRFVDLPQWRHQLNWMAKQVPLVAHNIGMSLGTLNYFDKEYIQFMKEMNESYCFRWHSDHLSFIKLPTKGPHDHNAGIAIPVPYDKDYLAMLREKISFITEQIELPFLIENNVYFVEYPDQDYSETDFINQLVSSNDQANILLDIHNLYANSVNHKLKARQYIDELRMDKVVEMHIAGGNEMGGMYMDSHAGPCPDEVWELLDYAVSKAPNLRGITFEFHESYFPLLRFDGLNKQIEMAKAIWNKHTLQPYYHELA